MKVYIITILIVFLLIPPGSYAQLPDFQWAKQAGGIGNEFVTSSASDHQGSIYIAGYFGSPIMEFGNDISIGNYGENSGTSDAFIAKYSSSGKIAWALRIGEEKGDAITAITTDSEGNIYACGGFNSSSIECGSTVLNNSGGIDCFITKIDSTGRFLWARKAGGIRSEEALSIAIDKSGNVLVAGYYSDTISFSDSISLKNPDKEKVTFFVAKYSSDGDVLFAKGTEQDEGSYVYAVTTDAEENIYVAGSFRPMMINFGDGISLTNVYFQNNTTDIFLTKYNKDGKPSWSRRMSSGGFDGPSSMAMDSSGNILLCGYFAGEALDFEKLIVYSKFPFGRYSFFTAKYNNNGDVLWAKGAEGQPDGEELPSRIAADYKNNVYVSGYFSSDSGGPVNFGNGISLRPPASPNTDATFIVRYDSAGNTISGNSFPWLSNAALAVHNDREIYLSGFFQGSIDFGNGDIFKSETYTDVFTAKLTMRTTSIADPDANTKPKAVVKILPNPSNGFFTIFYSLTTNTTVSILLTDVLGRQTLLKEETLDAGEHSAEINTANFPAGIYVLTLEAEGQVVSQKVVIEG